MRLKNKIRKRSLLHHSLLLSMGLAEGLKINNTMHTIVLQDNFLDDAAINNLEASTNKVEFFF